MSTRVPKLVPLEQRCERLVYVPGMIRGSRCGFRFVSVEGGHRVCHVHCAAAEAKRRAKRDAGWESKREARRREQAAVERMKEHVALADRYLRHRDRCGTCAACKEVGPR